MKVKERCLKTADMLKEILGSVNDEEVDRFVEVLIKAKKEDRTIFTLGIGRSNLIARTFAMRLMQIGYKSYVVYDTSTPAFKEGDLLIAVSGSGSTKTVLEICDQALKYKGKILAMTMKADSPLVQKAESTVVIPTGQRTEKIHSRGSEFEQSLFVLFDCIGVRLMEDLGCINDIEGIDPFIKILHANLQ